MSLRKSHLFALSLLLIFIGMLGSKYYSAFNPVKSVVLSSSTMPNSYTNIGYYSNSSSVYSNGAFYLLQHGAIGNSLVQFSSFTNLSQFSHIIIPFKLNWSQVEISSLLTFISQGGLAFLTASVPSELFNITTTSLDDFWIHPTEIIAQSIGDKSHLKHRVSYYRAAQDTSLKIYPFDIVRDLRYITDVHEETYEILHTVSPDSGGTQLLGFASVAKTIGLGQLVFSTIPFFDLWGMSAAGGPTVPSNSRLGLLVGLLSVLVNQFLTQIFIQQGTLVPLRWHTPFAKLALLSSRDDVDAYVPSAVLDRGKVDQAHGIPTIFYELTDQIPSKDWNDVLNVSTEFPLGYHIPGYHRHSAKEITAQAYLNRVLDIEQETGRSMYFECHHGAGSGFFGQEYVRSAIEATDTLNHFVLYTSSEGGNGNEYVEPFLYLLPNGTIVRAKNYYSFPKTATIDRQVNSRDSTRFKEIIEKAVFQNFYHRRAHWLLHSQNVKNYIATNYHILLKTAIDPIYEYLYPDPISFVDLNRAYVENVSISFKSNSSLLDIQIQANQNVQGYTFAIPYNRSLFLSNIKFDGSFVDLNSIKILHNGNSGYILFYVNLTKGSHNVIVRFQGSINQLAVDQDFDGIQDEFEVSFFGTSPLKYDSDYDDIGDGDEIFVYDTNPSETNNSPTKQSSSATKAVTDSTSSTTTSSNTATSSSTTTSSDTGTDSINANTSAFELSSIFIGLLIFVTIQKRPKRD
ncbi:MAG: hypothetical protein ACXACK_10185 [Candidatus Hodarchaeales archaeon]